VTIAEKVARPASCAVAILPDLEIILPMEGLIDHESERARQHRTLADLERQIGALRAKLGNESFLTRAPGEVVEQTRNKLAELDQQREAVMRVLGRA
jgi:valyl-tRNA synthetase